MPSRDNPRQDNRYLTTTANQLAAELEGTGKRSTPYRLGQLVDAALTWQQFDARLEEAVRHFMNATAPTGNTKFTEEEGIAIRAAAVELAKQLRKHGNTKLALCTYPSPVGTCSGILIRGVCQYVELHNR